MQFGTNLSHVYIKGGCMILKGAANFLLLLMQDVSVASVNRVLKQRRRRRQTAKKIWV